MSGQIECSTLMGFPKQLGTSAPLAAAVQYKRVFRERGFLKRQREICCVALAHSSRYSEPESELAIRKG